MHYLIAKKAKRILFNKISLKLKAEAPRCYKLIIPIIISGIALILIELKSPEIVAV